MSKFDWYQGTLDQGNPSESMFNSLQDLFDLSSWRKTGRGYQGYTYQAVLHRGSTDLLMMAWGGNEGVHLRCSGEGSSVLASWMRSHYCTHKVSRIDSCMDFEKQGLFDDLSKKMIDFANNRKPMPIKISMAGDWANGKGRTLYIGSRQSQIFIRLYEKGYERSNKLGVEVERPDWVRFEVEYKPQKEKARRMAQSFSPDDIFRLSYLPELMDSIGIDVGSQIKTHSAQYTDEEKARHFMLKQYGPTIANWVKEKGGSFDLVFDEIKEHVITNYFT